MLSNQLENNLCCRAFIRVMRPILLIISSTRRIRQRDHAMQVIKVAASLPLHSRVIIMLITVTSDHPGHEWHITIQTVKKLDVPGFHIPILGSNVLPLFGRRINVNQESTDVVVADYNIPTLKRQRAAVYEVRVI